jgi:hypothetical protein
MLICENVSIIRVYNILKYQIRTCFIKLLNNLVIEYWDSPRIQRKKYLQKCNFTFLLDELITNASKILNIIASYYQSIWKMWKPVYR